jgi:hypothetical protein
MVVATRANGQIGLVILGEQHLPQLGHLIQRLSGTCSFAAPSESELRTRLSQLMERLNGFGGVRPDRK